MINFAAISVVLLLARINAAYEDHYTLTEDDGNLFYNEPKTYQQFPKKLASSETKRRGTSGENFMRFGRSSSETLDDYDDFEYEEYARPTRSGINNNDRFIRFGRDKSSFLRFGRIPQRTSNFLRFGRDSDGLSRRKRDAAEKRERGSNFIRFGRGNGDNFMRFGRRDEVTPTLASGNSFRQSEILNQLEREHLLRLLAAKYHRGATEGLAQL